MTNSPDALAEENRALQAEIARLKAAEEQFRGFVTANSDIVYKMGPDWMEMRLLDGGNFLASTEQSDRIWVEKYIPQEDRSAVLTAIAKAIWNRTPFSLEHRVIRRDGSVGWAFSRAVPLLDSHGNILEWLGAATDITPRKRREAQLAFLADLTEALATLNTASEIVTVFGQRVGEFLGTEACVFVEIDEAQNEAVVVHDWYRKGEFSLIGHYSLREYFTHAFQARMSAGQVMVVQDVMQDPRISDPAKFAGIHIGSLVNVPLMRDGVWRFTFGLHHEQPYNWPDDEVALILEITTRLWNRLERIRAEEALLRRQAEIETLNSRLQRAMQETHHRIKNNLQTIAALVEMQGYSSAPSDEAAIHRINTHIRALATIHDLLTQQAKGDADLNDLNTHSMLGRLLPILQSSLVGRRIHAEIASLPIPVTQSAALTLLVNELISNAVKHTSGDIEIRLLLADAQPGQAERRMARLEVSDHGPGFPPGFDPRESANTGLELIESAARWDLKGDILYTNRPEGGACVIVTFPLLSPLA